MSLKLLLRRQIPTGALNVPSDSCKVVLVTAHLLRYPPFDLALASGDSGCKTGCATRLDKRHATATWELVQKKSYQLLDPKHHHSVCSVMMDTHLHGVRSAVSHCCSQVLGGLILTTRS